MDRRTVLTLSTTATLSGLYALYCVLFGPLLSPRPELFRRTKLRAEELPANDPGYAREAAEFLPDQPWTADAAYQAHVGRSLVFAREVEKVEDSARVKFT